MIALASAALVAGAGAVAAAPAATAGAYCSFSGVGHSSSIAYTDGFMGCISTQARAAYRTGSATTAWTLWAYEPGDGRATARANNVLNGGHRVEYDKGKYWTRNT